MLSFFRKKNEKIEKLGEESIVDSTSLLGDIAQENTTDADVTTSLSFHPDAQISAEDRYYFQFLNNELPPLKQNQISLVGIDIKIVRNEWHVTSFIRNSLSRPIRFEDLPLLLIGPNGETIGRKVFHLADLGDIPAESSRPWIFVFPPSNINVSDIPEKGWKLSFETKPKHRLDLDENWEKNLSPQNKEGLTNLVNSLEPPNPDEINLLGLDAEQVENGDLVVTILIRNGHNQDIQIENMFLIFKDATGEIVAEGGFNLNQLVIKADTSKPWTFIFPKGMLTKEFLNLSTWHVYLPRQQ